jgi:GTP cyclohydrolase II
MAPGSLKCDCKQQLQLSMDYIRENDGMVIYLQQEGRGVGLANKIAAYALQEVGAWQVLPVTHEDIQRNLNPRFSS